MFVLSALLAGNRNNNGNFNNLGNNANVWSSTENNATNANNLNLNNNNSNINLNNNNKDNGFSVRCLEDSGAHTAVHLLNDPVNKEEQLLEDLFTAYFQARRNKRNTINALAFELQYEKRLFELYEDIVNRTYDVAQSICFINFTPIQREIFAADFRDRIVHHLVFNYVNPVFENLFIGDSYSCRVNKGTDYGIKRIRRFISQCSRNYTEDAYIMKLDIEGYFMRMDRELLYQKVNGVCKNSASSLNCDPELLRYLLQKIVFNDPTANCSIRGRKTDWRGLPESKSLFCAEEGKGFPIGNLTSQLFGNIYLNDLDHYIKDELRVQYYGRYVDDFILIHKDRRYLLECRMRIGEFLRSSLRLDLHPRKFFLQHYSKGVQFLGVYIKPHRIYIGKRTKTNFYHVVRNWNTDWNAKEGRVTREELSIVRSKINSYLGLLSHYNTYKLRRKMMYHTLDTSFLRHLYFTNSLNKISLR